jgi:hypothetical protein
MRLARGVPLNIPVKAALLGVAAILAAAAPAGARAPSTADAESLDWILLRLAEDRDHEKSKSGDQDAMTAWQNGQGPLSDWEIYVKVILDMTPGRGPAREAAVTAVVARFKVEDGRIALDKDVLAGEKKKVARATLDMMLRNDTVSRMAVYRIQINLLPPERVQWKPAESATQRKHAYEALKKWLEAK